MVGQAGFHKAPEIKYGLLTAVRPQEAEPFHAER